MASKSAKRAAGSPKPAFIKLNRTTVAILAAGLLLSALTWLLFTRPAANGLVEAQEQREQAEAIQRRLEQEVASLSSGGSFQAAELPVIVGPVEAMLPAGGSPTDAVNRIQGAASANGVTIVGSSFPSNYSAPENGRAQATYNAEASGPLADMAAWLTAVRLDPQLITATVNAVTTETETGRSTMSITFTVWATDQETWADGLDQAPGVPGLTPQEAEAANRQLVPNEGG